MLLTIAEVAERLRVSTRSVRRLVDAGLLATVRCGKTARSDRFRPADIDAYINSAAGFQRGTFITPAQVEALAQACDNQAAADMIRLAAFSGLRLSELWRAEHQDGKLYLSETKSGKPRMVPLPVRVQAIAAKLPLPITRATFRRHFEKARTKVGLTHVRPHDMRHTFASLLIQAGASLATVQELMGHSTIAITKDLYGHLTDEHRDAAVRLLDNL